ncbi:MAG: DNA topoisomerase IV subunit A [Candidatus Geothermarchaeales archaeon]
MPSRKRREETREIVLEQLTDFGEDLYETMSEGRFPVVDIPSRTTSNIQYDEVTRSYVLGDRTFRRAASNIRHLKSLSQLVWNAFFAKELIRGRRTSTLRDVYYSSQAFDIPFRDQKESDDVITDLEAVAGRPREEFNIVPEERSSIFGDLTIEYTVPGYEGRRIDLTTHPDGLMVGHALRTAEFVETGAERVFAIEKGGTFTRFIEERVHERYRAILINTTGQAPRSTRYLIRRLNEELGLECLILTDADPWGMHIAMVIISGSANAAHIGGLATPDAKWMGVWASDMARYDLPSDPFTSEDFKRLTQLKKDIRYRGKLWQREIDKFMKLKRKSEQEAFSRYGLSYIVDKYLAEKMEEVESY